MNHIEFDRIDGERTRMLARMDAQQTDDGQLKRRALAELRTRLEIWSGEEGSCVGLDRDRGSTTMPIYISADRMELPIVRAISADRWRPSFGVTEHGAVHVTHDGNWLDGSLAVFVTGLSPLLDQVAVAFLSSVNPSGGRFFEHDGGFAVYPNEGRTRTFACVEPPGLLRRVLSAVHAWRSPVDEELVVKFDSGRWPSAGVLSAMGYRVGNDGLPARARRRILKQAFQVQLIATTPETVAYISEWGGPGTSGRRSKIENCLRGFAAAARQRRSADVSAAIADWEADLEWLRGPFGP